MIRANSASANHARRGTGVQAKQIADLIEAGVNTFSSLEGRNIWGSWLLIISAA